MQPANTAAVSGTAISSTAYNTLITDIGTEITNSVDRGGRSAMTAPLPMGAQKITGMADPTLSTDGATKNYVDTATATFFGTGDIKLTLKSAADAGWLLFDDTTFGSAISGATHPDGGSQNSQALFTLIFNNISDTYAPILTSGGGATTRAAQTNAASAWTANCRMSLPKMLGRSLAISGSGSGLTARTLGQTTGTETITLAAGNIPTITSVNASQAITVYPAGSSSYSSLYFVGGVSNGQYVSGTNTYIPVTNANFSTNTFSASNSISTTYTNASPTAFSIMQPTTFLNAMVKL